MAIKNYTESSISSINYVVGSVTNSIPILKKCIWNKLSLAISSRSFNVFTGIG